MEIISSGWRRGKSVEHRASIINSLKIKTTLIGKIPPTLPLPKGGIMPLFFASANQPGLRQRGVRGDFLNSVHSIMNRLISSE